MTARRLRVASHGQATIEYAFLLVLIGMICLAVVTIAGHQVQQAFSQVTQALSGQPAAAPTAPPSPTPTPAPTPN